MKDLDIVTRRMHNHRLWGAPFDTPEEVVHWLGAVQAQEFPVAKWSVAQRASGVTNAMMDRAFADGAILRTHVLRPTWHFVLPADIRWMLELTAPRVFAMTASYYRSLELDPRLLARSNRLIAKALQGDNHLTRKELAGALDRAGITASGMRLGFIVMRAELDALICSGAPRGKQQTYALLEERVPQSRSLDRDEAIAELTLRYFTARGPATLKDYRWWSSLTAGDARRGLEMVESRLEPEVVGGRTYWFTASSPGAKAGSNVIDLVQGYDECIIAYTESRDVLGVPSATFIESPAFFTNAILLRGRVIGHWRPLHRRDSVIVETYFYQPLRRAERPSLDAAVDRFGRFMGVPARAAAYPA